MIITSIKQVPEIPDNYSSPIFFIDGEIQVYVYNPETKVLRINSKNVPPEMLERVIAATNLGNFGVELKCRSIDSPVYFPVGTHVKKAPRDYVGNFCNHVRETMSLL